MRNGELLDPSNLQFARELGIQHAKEVRVMRVSRIPLPVPAWLLGTAARWRLPVFAPGGMALGQGIYLLHGQDHSLPHELVHVAQYERLGGIGAFMRCYLYECLTCGYAKADLEREARLRSRTRK